MYDDFQDFLKEIENKSLETELKDYCKIFGAEILYLAFGEGWSPSMIGDYLLAKYKNDLNVLASPRRVSEFLELYDNYLQSIKKEIPSDNLPWDKIRTLKRQTLVNYSNFISKARSEGKLKK